MGKKTTGKRSRKKPTSRAKPTSATKNQILTTSAIAVLSAYLTWSPMVPVIYLMVHVKEMDTPTQNLMAICFLLYGVITAGKPQLKQRIRDLEAHAFSDQKVHQKIRRYLITLLAISFFANVAIVIPVLYMRGYIAAVVAMSPTREQLGSKTVLGIAFVAGAVISGILGNLAYDLTKFAVRKISKRNNG